MKTIFVDTNIILDVLLQNAGLWQGSLKIFKLAELRHIKVYVSASSMTDIFYVASKKLSASIARDAIGNLLNLFEIVEVGADDLYGALSVPISDYEDALQAWCAKKVGADILVTRDVDGFASIDIPVFEPDNFEV